MSSAPLKSVVDFDLTLADLNVDWGLMRSTLGYKTIAESQQPQYWAALRSAELDRLSVAPVNAALVDDLSAAGAFAVLTNNSEAVVRSFLGRYPRLKARCAIVVGRESLRDSKQNPVAFHRGIEICHRALRVGPTQPWRYIGDSKYELVHARAEGAVVVNALPWARRSAAALS